MRRRRFRAMWRLIGDRRTYQRSRDDLGELMGYAQRLVDACDTVVVCVFPSAVGGPTMYEVNRNFTRVHWPTVRP